MASTVTDTRDTRETGHVFSDTAVEVPRKTDDRGALDAGAHNGAT